MAVTKDEATGKWQAQVWYTDWQGRRKRKHKRGFSSKREAQAWEREFLGMAHGENINIGTLIASFKDDVDTKVQLGNLKESTAFMKKNYLERYVEPYFTKVDAAKITTAHVNEWLKTINSQSHRGSRMSSGSLNVIRNLFSQVFEYGIKNHGLQFNPVHNSELLKPYTNDKRAKLWSLDQYHQFYASLKSEQHKVIFNTLFWTGLRIGELVVLTPNDVKDDKIYVVKSSTKIGATATKVGTTKNASSNRVVAIPHRLYQQIRDYIAGQKDLKGTDRIFSLHQDSIRSFLTYRAKVLGLPHISPHTMRHSYASHSLAATKDVAAVSYQLGHKTPETTLSVYSHMVPGANVEQAKKLDNLVEI